MPRVKGVKSLSQLCIDFVVNNMDHWCVNPSNEVDAMTEKRPFDELPLTILERIADARDRKFLNERKLPNEKQHTEILITEKTRHLKVWRMKSEETDDILRLASIKCLALRSISIDIFGDCENLITYIPKFHTLQILMIPGNSYLDDNWLKTVGTYCKDLRILVITSCRNVTDVGIEGLCVSVDCQNETGRSGQCKLIQKLDIERTGITRNGVLKAIENLPFLQVLLHQETLDVLAEIHQNALDRNILPIPSFSLTSLTIGKTWGPRSHLLYKPCSLGLAVTICPMVTVVHITVMEGLVDSDFHSLLALNLLVQLSINSRKSAAKIMFDGGVISLLKTFGMSLEVLHLEGVQGVNVGLMAEYCTNLLSLTLMDNTYLKTRYSWGESSNSPKKIKIEMPTLLKLETISIVNHTDRYIEENSYHDLSSAALLLIFSSPLLKCVKIHGCEVLSDKILQNAANIHHFLHLEELVLRKCGGVSKQGIDVFMNDLVPLRKMEIFHNRLLNRKIVGNWYRENSHKNWDLRILYSQRPL